MFLAASVCSKILGVFRPFLKVLPFNSAWSGNKFSALHSFPFFPAHSYFEVLECSPKWACTLSFDFLAGGAGCAGERALLSSVNTGLSHFVTDEHREIKKQRSSHFLKSHLRFLALSAVPGSVFAKQYKEAPEA